MQSIQCPLCHNQVFSENFGQGEKFLCPHCEHPLEIEGSGEIPKVKSASDMLSNMTWAIGIWKDGKLFLTPQKMAILGEILVNSLEMDIWSRESEEQLQERSSQFQKAEKILTDNDLNANLVKLARTMLDIFRNLKKNP